MSRYYTIHSDGTVAGGPFTSYADAERASHSGDYEVVSERELNDEKTEVAVGE